MKAPSHSVCSVTDSLISWASVELCCMEQILNNLLPLLRKDMKHILLLEHSLQERRVVKGACRLKQNQSKN